jgi:hypothetical protein
LPEPERRPLLTPALVIAPFLAVVVAGAAQLFSGSERKGGGAVAYAQVQALLAGKCSGCHPGVVPSLDLRAAQSYASMVGVRSIEAPALERVVAGDPERSFLFLKVAGVPGNHGNPTVGSRMPFGQGPLAPAQIDLLRRWIEQGARDRSGKTTSRDEVATPGSLPALAAAQVPEVTSGDAVIAGTVYDAHRRPLPGAVVTLLLVRKDLPGGEEHYLAGVAGPDGRYTIRHAPVGRVEIKAYAPKTVYVSRVLDTRSGQTTNGDVGLPLEAASTSSVAGASARTEGNQLALSLRVSGSSIDRNYTLAVNPASGRVFELRGPGGGERAGLWTRSVPEAGLSGRWILFSVSHACTTSAFAEATPST